MIISDTVERQFIPQIVWIIDLYRLEKYVKVFIRIDISEGLTSILSRFVEAIKLILLLHIILADLF